MQSTSALYNTIVQNPQHYFETKVSINNVDYGENKLFSIVTSRSLFKGNPEIGKAVAGEIQLRIIKPEETIPRRAEIKPYVRACVNNLKSEWLLKGIYYIDTREQTKSTGNFSVLNIHGYDALLFAEQYYSNSQLEWPATDIAVVQEITQNLGLNVDSRTWTVMNQHYSIPFPVSYTYREVLGYIAAMYCGNFIMTDLGELLLVPLNSMPTESYYLVNNMGYYITFGGDRILV